MLRLYGHFFNLIKLRKYEFVITFGFGATNKAKLTDKKLQKSAKKKKKWRLTPNKRSFKVNKKENSHYNKKLHSVQSMIFIAYCLIVLG